MQCAYHAYHDKTLQKAVFLQLIEMGLSGARQNVNGFQSFKSFSKTFVNMIKVEKSPKLVKGKTR